MWVVGRLDDKLGMFGKDDKRISSYIDPSLHTIWVHTQNIAINKSRNEHKYECCTHKTLQSTRVEMSTNMSVVHTQNIAINKSRNEHKYECCTYRKWGIGGICRHVVD
jgi:hypothetical protein